MKFSTEICKRCPRCNTRDISLGRVKTGMQYYMCEVRKSELNIFGIECQITPEGNIPDNCCMKLEYIVLEEKYGLQQ